LTLVTMALGFLCVARTGENGQRRVAYEVGVGVGEGATIEDRAAAVSHGAHPPAGGAEAHIRGRRIGHRPKMKLVISWRP